MICKARLHFRSLYVRHCCSFPVLFRNLFIKERQWMPYNLTLRNGENVGLKLNAKRRSKITGCTSTVKKYQFLLNAAVTTGSYAVLQTSCNTVSKLSQSFEHNFIICYKNSKGLLVFFSWALWHVWDFLLIIFRVFQLMIIFTPVLILFPITIFSSHIKSFWYRLLLFDLEFSGPIFIKLGQWASTRRDIFPEELCSCLSKLQRKTKAHSWFYTKYCLEKAFGPQWEDIFVKFDNNSNPIGSGCCAQVYKVWINPEAFTECRSMEEYNDCPKDSFFIEGIEMMGLGELFGTRNQGHRNYSERQMEELSQIALMPVAVKVRHPRMETMLRRDLLILKSVASAVTWIIPNLKWLSLVDCVDDFSHLMKAQVDLCVEASNLDKFADNFKTIESVVFPKPIWALTRPYLLVESYEEGEPMQNFVTCKTSSADKVNVILANLGINTILKMVFEDNFAHGDLHPGNMLVQERVHSSDVTVTFPLRRKQSPVSLVILDCGITASLDERGQKCLREVFAAVANGDGEKAGELFLNHSNHQCTDPESFKGKMKEIVKSALDRSVTLEKVEVASLLSDLFSTMIHYKVKLDGSFSSIILAIMVLEGLGRSLDPTIDVVEKAKPFLMSSALTPEEEEFLCWTSLVGSVS